MTEKIGQMIIPPSFRLNVSILLLLIIFETRLFLFSRPRFAFDLIKICILTKASSKTELFICNFFQLIDVMLCEMETVYLLCVEGGYFI